MSVDDVRVEINAMLEDIAAQIDLPTIEPDEITARMVADVKDSNVNRCKAYLDAQVKAGAMTKRWVLSDSHRMTAYRKVIGVG